MKRCFKILSSFIIGLSIIMSSIPTFAAVDIGTDVKKIYGKDRYATAVEVSKEGWKNTDVAIIANGLGFADALCSTPLSKAIDGPILLTSQNNLPTDTKNELRRLGAKRVYIIGGTGAVSNKVEKEIKGMGIKISRLGGANRYDTSLEVAKELSKFVNINNIMVISGEESTQGADALSVAPLAALNNMPMVLTSKKEMQSNIKSWINRQYPDNTYVIASNKTIDDKTVADLPRIERIYGKDRYDTNLKVLDKFNFYLEYDNVYVAQGTPPGTVDALTTGPLAAKKSSPLLLVSNKILSSQKSYLKGITANEVVGVGGMVENNILLDSAQIFDNRIATKVKSMTILNRRNIILEFNGIVKESPANIKENYEILGTNIIKSECIDGYDKVQLTFKSDLTDSKISTLEGKISNVVGKNITIGFDRKDIPVKDMVTDKVKPKISNISVLDFADGTGANGVKKKITIKFSEDVNEEDAKDIKNYKITDKNGEELRIIKIEFNKAVPSEVNIITPSVNDTSNYKLEVKGVRDLSNNIMDPYSKTISLKDTTKPKVIHFEITNTSASNIVFIDITFSKQMDEKSATTVSNYIIKDSTGKTDSKMIKDIEFNQLTKDSVRLTIENVVLDGTCNMTIKGIKDTVGNIMEQYDTKLMLNLNRPNILQPVPYDTPDKLGENKFIIRAQFDRTMNDKDVQNIRNYSLVSENNVQVTIESVKYDPITRIATITTKTLTEIGNYTLWVRGVKDSTGVELLPTKVPLQTNIIYRPGVIGAELQQSETRFKDILVGFDTKMDARTANDKNNYILTKMNTETPEVVRIKSARYSTGTIGGRVMLTTEDFSSNGIYKLTIKNVKDATGVSINESDAMVTIDNIKPQVAEVSGVFDKYDRLNIKFSEAMSRIDVETNSNYSLKYTIDGEEKTIGIKSVVSNGNIASIILDEELKSGIIYQLNIDGIYSEKAYNGATLKMEECKFKFQRKVDPANDKDVIIEIK
ncbi:cell wall-binding repeat-containing protein [Clostridium senegalense]|uniref:cell wall-binding repeat-containing protein n=1 Tax=Clostridium senegalense TaxID=1465809 RepID=UPI001C123813|nr:cell wall-binding repeat-containing protein [Clostridium senegalense]MBU5228046.1 cell wall-binding repeat-containing protein [Clostridium senegalense]